MDTLLSLLLDGLSGMLMEKLQPAISVGAAVVAIVCLAFCFWGYKLTKVMFAIMCFFTGLLLGVVIVMVAGGNAGMGLLLGAVMGVGLAYLSKYIYKALVFLANGGLVLLLFTLFGNDETMGMMVLLGIVLGAVVGFFAVKYLRFSLILFTSLFYGLTAGMAILLVVGAGTPGMGLLAGAVLVAFGFHYQWKSTGGGSFKDYFLLRKTEAEQERLTARATARVRPADAAGTAAAPYAEVPADLLGISFFEKAAAYAAVLPAVALVLSLLPVGRVGWGIVLCLAVAAGIYLSPCEGLAIALVCRVLPLFSLFGSASFGPYLGETAADLLFVLLVSVGCRRFSGIVKHMFVFAVAGIASELLLLYTSMGYYGDGVYWEYFGDGGLLGYVLVPFFIMAVVAAAFEEFAMPLIIARLPARFRGWFQTAAAPAAVCPEPLAEE